MNDAQLLELFEKLYFHEIEVRERISTRLQIPLAILLSIVSVDAYLMKGISIENGSLWNLVFGVVFLFSIVLVAVSGWYFIRGFYGHTYEFLPSGLDIEGYRQKLLETYKEYDKCDNLVKQHFKDYINKNYNECSSTNTIANDKRSENLHKCNSFLILTSLPLSAAFLIFTLSDIDKNLIEKEYKVRLTNPISLQTGSTPIIIEGHLNTTTMEIDFSEDIKELLNERRKETTTITNSTSTTSSSSSEEGH